MPNNCASPVLAIFPQKTDIFHLTSQPKKLGMHFIFK
jgi:hypothetical protein